MSPEHAEEDPLQPTLPSIALREPLDLRSRFVRKIAKKLYNRERVEQQRAKRQQILAEKEKQVFKAHLQIS